MRCIKEKDSYVNSVFNFIILLLYIYICRTYLNAERKKVNYFVADNCCDDYSNVISYCTPIYVSGIVVFFKLYFTYYDVVLFITSKRVKHLCWCCFKTVFGY